MSLVRRDFRRAKMANPFWQPDTRGVKGQAAGTQTGVAGRVWIASWFHPMKCTISSIGVIQTVLGGAGTNFRLGAYPSVGLTPASQSLIEDSGNIAADASTGFKSFTLTSPYQLKGYLFLVLETQDTTITFQRRAASPTSPTEVGSEVIFGARYERVGGYGALTDPCPAVTVDASASPCFWVRIDSVDE